jgi:lipid A 3-O-deacylase
VLPYLQKAHSLVVLAILLLGVGVMFFPRAARAQERNPFYSREISMSVDNDIIFFVDFYYTAGQDIIYRRLVNPHAALYRRFRPAAADSSKVILQYHTGYKIFTPRNIDFSSTKTMDRPYAGWTFGSVGISNFPSPNISNRYEAELGVVGKASGMGQLQTWVHKVTDFEEPAGWSSQIRDEVVINFYYTRYYEQKIISDIGLVAQSAAQIGTGGNRLSEDIILRLLEFNPINNSVFTQSRVNWETRAEGRQRKQEIFIFVDYGFDYVASNIFIEGSLFNGNRSPFTVAAQPWVFRRNVGLMYSNHSVSWSLTLFHLTKEVKTGTEHDYGSLALAVRF